MPYFQMAMALGPSGGGFPSESNLLCALFLLLGAAALLWAVALVRRCAPVDPFRFKGKIRE